MKKVLSLLLAYAFLQAQTWALGGGPRRPSDATALIGTYSGVLIPSSQSEPPTTGIVSAASIGLFSVGVPQIGVATGSCVVFVNGVAFIGDMIGVADPEDNTFSGIVEAQSTNDVVTLIPVVNANGTITFQQTTTPVFAQGNILADITNAGSVDPLLGVLPGSVRLEGKAELDLFTTLNNDGTPQILNTVTFSVDGFKQSDTATTVTITLTGGPGGVTP